MRSVEKLDEDIQDLLPTLKTGLQILCQESYLLIDRPENILKARVCGRATKLLGFMLRQKGYQATRLDNMNLGSQYVSNDHAVLSVEDLERPDDNVVVDPTYYQYIDIFYLLREQMPVDEVLIVRQSDVIQKAREFAFLKDLRLATHPDPSIFKKMPQFDLSHEELTKYFAKIWDLKHYSRCLQPTLEEVIVDYQKDPLSIHHLTRELIEELDLVSISSKN
jgi:hypothetical protein